MLFFCSWIERQRSKLNAGTLEEDKKQKLELIGVTASEKTSCVEKVSRSIITIERDDGNDDSDDSDDSDESRDDDSSDSNNNMSDTNGSEHERKRTIQKLNTRMVPKSIKEQRKREASKKGTLFFLEFFPIFFLLKCGNTKLVEYQIGCQIGKINIIITFGIFFKKLAYFLIRTKKIESNYFLSVILFLFFS